MITTKKPEDVQEVSPEVLENAEEVKSIELNDVEKKQLQRFSMKAQQVIQQVAMLRLDFNAKERDLEGQLQQVNSGYMTQLQSIFDSKELEGQLGKDWKWMEQVATFVKVEPDKE